MIYDFQICLLLIPKESKYSQQHAQGRQFATKYRAMQKTLAMP